MQTRSLKKVYFYSRKDAQQGYVMCAGAYGEAEEGGRADGL